MAARARTSSVSALLVAILAGGCGGALNQPTGGATAGGTGGATGNGGQAGGGAARQDAGHTMDGSGTGGAVVTPDGGSISDDGPTGPVDSWIYVATEAGVARVDRNGGEFKTFGLAAPTHAVFPSPSGQLVAQEMWDERVAVFDVAGTPRATFDVRTGLLGWSDDATLLFYDPLTEYLLQTSVDGATRVYLPMPPGVSTKGITAALPSPDHSLIAALASPVPSAVQEYTLFVLAASDGSLVRNFGSLGGSVMPAWTGDNRLFLGSASQGFKLVSPRSGATTPVSSSAASIPLCGVESWYQAGTVILEKSVSSPGSDTGMCVRLIFDTATGTLVSPGLDSVPIPFAQAADGVTAAVGVGTSLELGSIAGGARRQIATAPAAIGAVGWAHPTGGTANLVPPPAPIATAAGLAGPPASAGRSGATDCRTGRWVNRTPAPLPTGWPEGRHSFAYAFDTDRGTLLVEGGYRGSVYARPDFPEPTMEWDGAAGQWTNLSRPGGFGPTSAAHSMSYDAHHEVIWSLGVNLPSDGPWTWTVEAGWNNVRSSSEASLGPVSGDNASSVYDLQRDRWIVSGGYTSTATWEWDGTIWQQSAAPPPGGSSTQLAGARLVYDSKRGHVLSVGNRDRGPSPWLYEPDQNRWTAQTSTGPSPLPRDWAGVAYDARRDRLMVFGGYVLDTSTNATTGGVTGGLSEWDPASGAWQDCTATGQAPSARMNMAFAYDPTRDVLVLFGGDPGDASMPVDVWEWYVP